MKQANDKEFEGWLQKGLGRAAVFLKSTDARMWREPLLYACTHNLIYDPQCEEQRAPYLLKLIEISGEREFYLDRIAASVSHGEDVLDISQMFEILGPFANQSSEVRRALNAAYDKHGFVGAGLGAADQLVILDGMSGLLLAMKGFGEEEADDRPWQFRHLIETLEEHHGKQPLPRQLDRFFDEWQEYERLWEAKKPPQPRQSYDSLKQSLTYGEAMRWARKATPEELVAAAEDLLAERDEKRQSAYLAIFRKHVFPGPIDSLIGFARSTNDLVARNSVAALSNVTDRRVRDLGLELIAKRTRLECAVDLLIENSQPSDYTIFEELLSETHEPDTYHSLGIDIRHFVGAHRSTDAERTLLMLYEIEPCSMCRNGVIDELIAVDRFPDWMREECRFDAYSETRKLVSPKTDLLGYPSPPIVEDD